MKSNLERAEELAIEIEDETEHIEVVRKIQRAFDVFESEIKNEGPSIEPNVPEPKLEVMTSARARQLMNYADQIMLQLGRKTTWMN